MTVQNVAKTTQEVLDYSFPNLQELDTANENEKKEKVQTQVWKVIRV